MSKAENVCGLTFDLDDVTIRDEEVISTLDWLSEEFGDEFVWYRISSSGEGLHVMIGELVWDDFTGTPHLSPIPMPVEMQMIYRKRIPLECRGRRISDSYRQKVGLRTSRVFETKNGKTTSEWMKWK